MKTLINVFHPHYDQSIINKFWVEELGKYPERYTVHNISAAYPDGKIDPEQEQQLIESHKTLILQFPIFWFSGPPLLKSWLDEVLTHGWAYGRNGGDKLTDRKVALAVTAGVRRADYSPDGRYHYTMNEILVPFEATLKYYCHADYRSFFAFYGAENTPGEDYASTQDEIKKSAQEYIRFLENL